MIRLAASLTVCAAAGCVLDGSKPLGQSLSGVPIATPGAVQAAPESIKTAERVQALGDRIIELNPFTGLTPLFHTLGVSDPILFHRGPDELFISDGLVASCKTEAQLAAVLCSELGCMMAEKRSAKRVGVELESVRDTAEPSALGEGEVASSDSQPPKPAKPHAANAGNAAEFAKEILSGAGFDTAELAKAQSRLANVKRTSPLGRQIAGPAPAPRWQP